MLRLEDVAYDHGFPVVAWTETRNLIGTERIECRIKREAGTNRLMFVRIGNVPDGPLEEGKPWEMLEHFVPGSSPEYYWTGTQQTIVQHIINRSRSFGMLAGGGSKVLVAGFRDDWVPIHLSCADCAKAEQLKLIDRLIKEFGTSQDYLIRRGMDNNVLSERFLAASNSPLSVYHPNTKPPKLRSFEDLLLWAVPIGLVAGLCGFVSWAVGLLKF
jgi:hypothetical protein